MKQRFNKTIDYLGKDAMLYSYYNHMKIDHKVFDEKSIVKQSKLSIVQFDTRRPSFTNNFLSLDELDDDTDLF